MLDTPIKCPAFALTYQGVEVNDSWSDDTTQSGGGLRKFAEDMAAQNKELMKRLEGLEAQSKRNAVADMIEAQGVKRSAAQYYNGDPEPEKVSEWVTNMRTTFGGASPVEEQNAQPVLNASDQEQYQRLMQAGQGGTPVGSNADSLGAALTDAKSNADMIAAFQKFGR